jgi:hypothetical protein
MRMIAVVAILALWPSQAMVFPCWSSTEPTSPTSTALPGFSRLLVNYAWRGNLDAFNDLLRGGFGTPGNGWVLKWRNSELSRSALGYEATIQRLERVLITCHPSHRLGIEGKIRRARSGQGPTLFDEIVEIIREHGPGGRESEDSIVLELV